LTTSSPSLAESAAVRAALEIRLGHCFDDGGLLDLALQHRSWCAEHTGTRSNERLEFLGDAVLSLVVAEHVHGQYPQMPEGELAKMRAAVVNSEALAVVGAQLGLGSALLLGKGEETSGGRDKSSILADATEAVIGAMYLDGGVEPARALIMDLLGTRIERAAEDPGTEDYKSRLQEFVAQRFETSPRYELTHDGPDHQRRFFATVFVDDDARGRGEGSSKKLAEQAAARAAWDVIEGGAGVAGFTDAPSETETTDDHGSGSSTRDESMENA
jgi:ribonuclease-3